MNAETGGGLTARSAPTDDAGASLFEGRPVRPAPFEVFAHRIIGRA
jgi:hypothetical protein